MCFVRHSDNTVMLYKEDEASFGSLVYSVSWAFRVTGSCQSLCTALVFRTKTANA